MLSVDCPMRKIVCDGCLYLSTGGCTYPRNVAFTATQLDIDEMWDKEKERLMNLPKETLVEMIMGRKGVYY